MNAKISCIFSAFQGSCANLNFIKLAGYFCVSPTPPFVSKNKNKSECLVLNIGSSYLLSGSPDGSLRPWKSLRTGRRIFFFFIPLMFFFQHVSETEKSHFISIHQPEHRGCLAVLAVLALLEVPTRMFLKKSRYKHKD